MDINTARRYTVEEINAIADALVASSESRLAIIAALLSNPNVIVIPPQATGRGAPRPNR